jgi:hypothetical protein
VSILCREKGGRWKLDPAPKGCQKLAVPDRQSDLSGADHGCTVTVGRMTRDTRPDNRRLGVAFFLVEHDPEACSKCRERAKLDAARAALSAWMDSRPEGAVVRRLIEDPRLTTSAHVRLEVYRAQAALVEIRWLMYMDYTATGFNLAALVAALAYLPEAVMALQLHYQLKEVAEQIMALQRRALDKGKAAGTKIKTRRKAKAPSVPHQQPQNQFNSKVLAHSGCGYPIVVDRQGQVSLVVFRSRRVQNYVPESPDGMRGAGYYESMENSCSYEKLEEGDDLLTEEQWASVPRVAAQLRKDYAEYEKQLAAYQLAVEVRAAYDRETDVLAGRANEAAYEKCYAAGNGEELDQQEKKLVEQLEAI